MVIARSILAAVAAALLFDRLRVPAGALFGAMVAAVALNLGGMAVAETPEWLRFASYAVLGWILGSQITRDTLVTLRAALVPVAVIVVSLLVAGALVAIGLRLAGIDAATAFLAASPGGISQMAAISVEIGANAPLVVTAHLVRVAVVIATAPFIVRLLE